MALILENIDDAISTDWIEDLIILVQDEIFAYRTYLNQLKAQQTAIIDRDIRGLIEMTKNAHESVEVAEEASQKRQEKIQEAADHIRDCKELNSLKQIIPLVRRDYSFRLNELREKLIDVLSNIKFSNQTSVYLIQRSLNFVNSNLDLLCQEIEKNDSYGSSGKVEKSNRISTIVKIA